MGLEIELKLRVASHDDVRERVRAAGGVHVRTVLESNHLFDTPDGRLRAMDCGLRLRTERRIAEAGDAGELGVPQATLTYKGPRQPSGNGDAKQRTELETRIEDPDVLVAVLEQLGLRETIVYEKRRELWQCGEVEVALDTLPVLGRFVEIEGLLVTAVVKLRRQLGLEHAELCKTYVEMAAEQGVHRPDGAFVLKFGGADASA